MQTAKMKTIGKDLLKAAPFACAAILHLTPYALPVSLIGVFIWCAWDGVREFRECRAERKLYAEAARKREYRAAGHAVAF